MATFLFWTPRLLAIAFAVFLALFALDSTRPAELLVHLIPSLLVLAILAIAWKREWVGAVLFIALGLSYVVWTWGRFPPSTYFAIAGPLVLIGALFLATRRHAWR